jgi:type VI protein secretion system component VasF
MSAEYERQLEQQNEQLQQKLAGVEQSFNRQLMEQTHKASGDAYTHYAETYRWIFTGMSTLIVMLIVGIVLAIERNHSISKQLDDVLKQPIARQHK